MKRIALPAFVALLAVASVGAGVPPALSSQSSGTTPKQPFRIKATIFEDQSRLAGAAVSRATPHVREMVPNYVFRLAGRWPITPPNGTRLSICFDGGEEALRERIVTIAAEWSQFGGVTFNAGSPGAFSTCAPDDRSTNIRIGFREAGYWSVVGNTPTTDAHTMNFEALDTDPPADDEFKKTVLHEFGHSMGFEHEHQHPEGGCDAEFDWNTVYATLGAPPNNWSQEKVDFNLRSFRDSSAYGLSPVDRSSIMHYTLPSWMFKTGTSSKCYVAETLDLSTMDKQGVAKYYPPQYTTTTAANEATSLEKIAAALPKDAAEAKAYLKTIATRIRTMKENH
jgi:hypothetical protein